MPVGRDRARELFKAAKTGDVCAIERLLGTRKKGGGRSVPYTCIVYVAIEYAIRQQQVFWPILVEFGRVTVSGCAHHLWSIYTPRV